jgi:flagellar hook assembly protein FlgD
MPHNSSVQLVVYDIMGREIKSVNIQSQSPGTHQIVWDGKNENGTQVSSGVYLYRIHLKSLENSQEFVKTAKMLLLK